jgi:7,8-dihydropterin-6-yl-methyl-4-(beta-D-ribofuranosyl)aminobenzene 5'-phosphate synthase
MSMKTSNMPGGRSMLKKILLIFLLFTILCAFPFFSQTRGDDNGFCSITVLYDNYVSRGGTKADWGFSCLIQGMEKTILFDTGTKPDILLHNMKELKVDENRIDLLVLSHMHTDHTGGIPGFLEKNNHVLVYIPAEWPEHFTARFLDKKVKVERIQGPEEIIKNVHLTGGLGSGIIEQAVVLDTPQGLVIITGCAHPGIVEIVKKAKAMIDKKIYLVLGGFHLLNHSEGQIKQIIDEFKKLGVKKCAATHCTGDPAIRLFQEAYGGDYIPAGTGVVINIPQLEKK